MSSVIRPYADAEGIFEGVDYRPNTVEPFQRIDIDGGDASTLVRVDDLRTIPQHELKLRLNFDALKPHYEKHFSKLRLTIIARDTTLRRELRLASYAMDEVPSTIGLDRSLLRTTSFRDVLPLELSVILDQHFAGGRALPTQRASRLAELRFVIRNSAGGAAFPFKRVTAEELRAAGKPAETGLHLELLCDAQELVTASDTPIAQLLEVWVHEKVWAATQLDRNPVSARLRLTSMTIMTAQLILASVVPLLKKGETLIEEKSVIGQLLAHIEEQASLPSGQLRRHFEEDASLQALEPYLQHSWRFVSTFAKMDEEESEDQS